ncbi:phage tail protein [Aliikangiella maris]|uniref:Phage tail protein n=2 Tax=Aliikangiella maris TaxID=3162458 RepID=A0ABV3MKI3_9GAMM
MDANGLPFWMIARGEQLTELYETEWDDDKRVLQLLSTRANREFPADRVAARNAFNLPTSTVDSLGHFAYVDELRHRILVAGALPDAYELINDEQLTFVDIAMSPDGALYAIVKLQAQPDELRLINPADSNQQIILNLPDLAQADLLALLPEGGGWILDRQSQQLYKIINRTAEYHQHHSQPQLLIKPFSHTHLNRPNTNYNPGIERPCDENEQPCQIVKDTSRQFNPAHQIVAMASNNRGEVGILIWPDDDLANAYIIFITASGLSAPVELLAAKAPISLSFVKNHLWAVKFVDYGEAVVYELPPINQIEHSGIALQALGAHYPLVVSDQPNNTQQGLTQNYPFAHSLISPAYYLAGNERLNIKPLFALSKPNLAKSGSASLLQNFDSQQPATCWHRIYIEAKIPPETGIRIWLMASDEQLAFDVAQAFPHDFGYVPAFTQLPAEQLPAHIHTLNHFSTAAIQQIPKAAFCTMVSESPSNKSLLYCQHQPEQSGLFTLLVQRTGRRVRELKGRFLKVKVELFGNGQASPEIAAIRIYSPRFSYLKHYLPEIYQETLFGEKADETGSASGSDFLQRYLSLFESVLTPLEDRIAHAHLVTNPDTVPAESLDWLANWVGLSIEQGVNTAQRRNMIKQAMPLYRIRGTYAGLSLALNIATGGMVERGELVILEDFKLRRTFATIIGIDLEEKFDPLMMNSITSANSYLGDTFFLGETALANNQIEQELLALFDASMLINRREKSAVIEFFARLANRITILVHRQKPEAIFKLIRKVVSLEAPAHIQTRVLEASQPLIVGLYSLVGVDTYLKPEPGLQPAKLDDFYFGADGQIIRQPSVDERLM